MKKKNKKEKENKKKAAGGANTATSRIISCDSKQGGYLLIPLIYPLQLKAFRFATPTPVLNG